MKNNFQVRLSSDLGTSLDSGKLIFTLPWFWLALVAVDPDTSKSIKSLLTHTNMALPEDRFPPFKRDYLDSCSYDFPDDLLERLKHAMIDVFLDQHLVGQFEEQFSAFVAKINEGPYDIPENLYEYLRESMLASRFYEPLGYDIKG